MATQSTSTTSGVTRITGTYSGLDVDALVKAGLSNDQNKLDKAKQSEQIMEWKQEQYRKIMKDVTDFNNKYLSSTGEKSLVLSSDWNAMKATSSNEAAVTASAATGADVANYTVNVTQLAKAASATLSSTSSNFKADNYITVTDEKSGTPKQIKLRGSNQQEIAKNLNSDLSTAGIQVTAKYSDFASGGDGGLVLESSVLGAKNKFSVTIQSSSAPNTDLTDSKLTVSDGQNAKATIKDSVSGVTKTYTGNSNQVTYNGVTFGFKDVTTTAATVSATKDTSTIADKLTSFVTDYNSLMTEINGKLYETYDKSYQPLTDTQKEAMTDSQIEKWNTKAQTGLLRKDEYLTNLASDMKETMTTIMKGSGFNLEKLGITPVQDYGSKNGTYTITDKSKLTSALNDNFDKVYELFNKTSSATTWTKAATTDGILSKLKVAFYNNVTGSDSKMAKKAGVEGYSTDLNNELTKAMTTQKTLIDTLEDKIKDKETSLYNKYSSLETQLSSLDSQAGTLSSYFS
ncbi:flagellar filament capping protein FliD [Clostridium beijerinckii]|uniref:flagellar filament capping protein FliD n=1 Tax=Clostridium beijerinckii TaxID=1520 RepID=UPI0015710177|nr:flagellar filament capping protein FliD [Clostridium beijerinckii]NRT73720.1 flagellar hook-associated protein 2 [Clostridium beijerinckii]